MMLEIFFKITFFFIFLKNKKVLSVSLAMNTAST